MRKKLMIVILILSISLGLFCQTKISKGQEAPFTGIIFSEQQSKIMQERILKLQEENELLKKDVETSKSIEVKRIMEREVQQRMDFSFKQQISFMETMNKMNLFGKIKFRFFQVGFIACAIGLVGMLFWELGRYSDAYIRNNYN